MSDTRLYYIILAGKANYIFDTALPVFFSVICAGAEDCLFIASVKAKGALALLIPAPARAADARVPVRPGAIIPIPEAHRHGNADARRVAL